MDDPYPSYAELLRSAEPHYLENLNMWLVVRYDHVSTAVKDHAGLASADGISYHRTALPVLFGLDQPDHTRIRRLVGRDFSQRRVQLLRFFIEQACGELLDEAVATGEIDIVQQAAVLLPVRVVTTILGIPGDNVAKLKLTAGVLESFVDNSWVRARADLGPEDTDEEQFQVESSRRALYSTASLSAFLNGVLRERRAQPLRDDVVSKLFTAGETGGITADEIRWTILTLLVGGQETMTHFLGNMLQALLDNPDQLRLLRERPDLIGSAIEETARYYPPVQNVFRTATTDVVVGDTTIPKNARVELSFAAANRDPRVFPAPDEFRVDREMDGHLGFGAGIHMCIGRYVARLQAGTFLRMLIERTNDIELIGELVKIKSPAFRGLEHLPVRLTPSSLGRGPASALAESARPGDGERG